MREKEEEPRVSPKFLAWTARRMDLSSAGMGRPVREIRSSLWAQYLAGPTAHPSGDVS